MAGSVISMPVNVNSVFYNKYFVNKSSINIIGRFLVINYQTSDPIYRIPVVAVYQLKSS